MEPEKQPPKIPSPRRFRRFFLWTLLILGLYLVAESFLPPRYQPSARVSVALIRAYQSIGSPALRGLGVQCRYTPTCSHYALDAIEYFGTLGGIAKTVGRLWRCSPWGGSGYDPATPEGTADPTW